MQFQRLQITGDKRVILDDFEIKNVKEFEIKSPAEEPAELVLKLDVIIGQVGLNAEV